MKSQPQPTHTMSSEQASMTQQTRVETVNPEIERKRKSAIDSSPKKRPMDSILFPVTDPYLLNKIEESGLTKKMESIGKIEWQHHKGKDKVALLLGFIERYGRVYGQSNYAENSLAKRNEMKGAAL